MDLAQGLVLGSKLLRRCILTAGLGLASHHCEADPPEVEREEERDGEETEDLMAC